MPVLIPTADGVLELTGDDARRFVEDTLHPPPNPAREEFLRDAAEKGARLVSDRTANELFDTFARG